MGALRATRWEEGDIILMGPGYKVQRNRDDRAIQSAPSSDGQSDDPRCRL